MTTQLGFFRGMQVAVAVSAMALASYAQSQEFAASASQPGDAPARLTGFEDQARFTVFKNEDPIASIKSQWNPDGSFTNEATLAIGGLSVTTTLRIEADADGCWNSITVESPRGRATVTRAGLRAELNYRDKVTPIELKPGAVLYENLTPALFSLMIRQYDRAAGGKQAIPTFVIPQASIDVTLEYADTVERALGGVDRKFDRFKCGFPGVDMTLWADEAGCIVMTEVPQQYAAMVREGYDALRKPTVADPRLSQPEYEVTLESDVMVPMRDGVGLATDIYRPSAEGRFPVILMRTPYKKNLFESKGRFFARRGYIVAAQDCRGRFASQGRWEPFVHEAEDGYDAIEWLAARPWSTGKVGMIGASYGGWVQWWAASRNPPHLTTIIPSVSPPDPAYNVPYEYGVFFLLGGMFWADVVESEATADLSGAALEKIGDKKYETLLGGLPVIDLDEKVLGKRSIYWRKWIENPPESDYWIPVNFHERMKDIRIPVFHQSGWFDGDGIGTKLNYARMNAHGHPYQKLVLGPWGHTDAATRVTGGRDFGPQALIDLQTEYLRWFDRWLKGIENGIEQEPLVSVFVMGTNRWLHGDVYPLPETEFQKWYLTSAGDAHTIDGGGCLTLETPPPDCPPGRYTYDPGDPTPDLAIRAGRDADEVTEKTETERARERREFHDKTINARKDILVYQTEPLTEPLTIAGPLSMVLYAATSAPDTDWFARLYEVTADGEVLALTTFGGKIRARYREGMSRPRLLEPGVVYEYTLDLWHTATTIPAGNRLRLEVASACFPLFSRNLNTGGKNEIETDFTPAEQTIRHDERYPSHVLLPVIPPERLQKE